MHAHMLTTESVKALKASKGAQVKVIYRVHREPDDKPENVVPGFGCRVTEAGYKSFVLTYRVAGQERRLTIGSFSDWTVAEARKEARKLRKRIDQGEDPLAEREAERAAPTIKQLAERYEFERLPRNRPRTQIEYKAIIRQWILPVLGNKKVVAVRRNDVETLHRKISETGAKVRANRVVSLLSAMMTQAIRWEYRADNPCQKAVDRNPEAPRKRYLTAAEIARLGEALVARSSQQAANAIRLLTLTGARRNEVLTARWKQFDLEAGIWRKPASSTKQKADHEVPLSGPAQLLLAEMKAKATSELLFPGRSGHLQIRGTWETVRKAAGLEDVHLHDLRHSFASILASAGASLPLIGALLGHSNPTTTHRYAHLFLDPQRAAVERVGATIMGGAEPGDVVPIGRARR